MKRFIKFTFSLLFTLIFAAAAAQAQSSGWTRIESENKEISFAVPSNYSFFFDKKGFTLSNPKNSLENADYKNLRSLTAHENGATLFFESYDVVNAGKALPFLLSLHSNFRHRNISFEKFSGLEVTSEGPNYRVFYYFASEKNIYLIGVGAREKTNETLSRFLTTIKLNGKNMFNSPARETVVVADKTISINALRETLWETANNADKKEKKKNEEKKSDEVKAPEAKSNNSKALVVLFKPPAAYTDDARRENETGTVRVVVTFQANGQIGKFALVNGLRHGLTENAIKALRRMRFIPAEKDNAPITITKPVEYVFWLY